MFEKLFKKRESASSAGSLVFRTTLKCQGCVAKVQPYLDSLTGIESWEVDLESQERRLIVRGNVDPKAVQEKVEEAGYKAELL